MRKTLFVCVGIAGLIVAYFGVGWYVRNPHTPRAMFHEWEPGERGWSWRLRSMSYDKYGTWMLCDSTLNLLVLVITADPGPIDFSPWFQTDRTTLFRGSRHEVMFMARQNAIIIIIPDLAQHTFSLAPGEATAIWKSHYETLLSWDEQDIIREFLEVYQGEHRTEIEELVGRTTTKPAE